MESPAKARAWYFFSEDLPEGEVIVPIKSKHGLAFAVKKGAEPQEILDSLNETARFVLDVGLGHISQPEMPPNSD
ncbi:hypothetical protein [Streptomyces sp. NPDC008137]|uniref:hypothetical protein n=1 Tax=Streptomyces sp. NPDC008137 TaxID=3364813 RepID=UPI0036EE8353